MSITLTYIPGKGVSFDGRLVLWGADRKTVRDILNDFFEVHDDVIDFSKYHDGDHSYDITQRRDVYKNYKGSDNFFFLNYDMSDNLRELEVHHGLKITIGKVNINFSMQLEEVASALNNISTVGKRIAEGEYFYDDLKLTIASHEAMGGEGNELAYFYCSNDVSHLVE